METVLLSHDEQKCLRTAIVGHDQDVETSTCECGYVEHSDESRTEHLLEVAFRSGELFAIMGR